ncbi:MAG: CAP domain-containing protein [Thermodesulfobacteriota bacterium]
MKLFRRSITTLLLAVLAFCASASAAQAATSADLSTQAYLLWQGINQARHTPRAALSWLGIDETTARAALGQDAWILDQGLPPLAWNDQLASAAGAHGRDMLDNLYYSHTSPTGLTPALRIAAAGYQALLEEEALAALVFTNPFPMDEAVVALLDNLLRDELTATPGAIRKIFSPNYSEAGLALLAESVALLDGQPYVYMLVADFAQPVAPRHFMVGMAEPGSRITVRNLYTGVWDVLPLLPGDAFQYPLSGRGEELTLRDANGGPIANATTAGQGNSQNLYVDLVRPTP